MYRWKITAIATGGIAARMPPAAWRPKSVVNRPVNSAIATGIVFAAFVEVKISA